MFANLRPPTAPVGEHATRPATHPGKHHPATPLLAIAAVVLGLACKQGGDRPDARVAESEAQPNVLVVVLDDVGTDLIGSYAEHPDAVTLPVIDDLARRGVSFDAAWVEPVCSSTRAALLTGLHPSENGIGQVTNSAAALATAAFTTLPREARRLGYYSFAVGKCHLAGAPAADLTHPNLIGFDYFAGSMRNFAPGDYSNWTKVVNGIATDNYGVYATSDVANEAIAQIQHPRDQPWFGWVAFHAAHNPRHVPPNGLTYSTPSASPEDAKLARLMLESLDIELGRLLEKLPASEPTTVFLIADNGTPEAVKTPPFEPGHAKASVYEGGLRVPLIVQGHGVDAAAQGRRSPARVQAPDLFATIVELLGGEASPTGSSRSFEPCLRDPERCAHREIVYAERFRPNNPSPGEVTKHDQAAREARYKLIIGAFDAEELYDLVADSEETLNLLPGPLTLEQEQVYQRLRAEILPRRLIAPVPAA